MMWRTQWTKTVKALRGAGWKSTGPILPDNGSNTQWFISENGDTLKMEMNDGDPREELEEE